MAKKAKDLTGEKFGEYTILKKSCNKKYHWECKCSCGTIKDVSTSNLTNGTSTRCKNCVSPERNKKISESLKGNQYAKGSKRTEEQLQKQRERIPRGKDHWLYGKHPSEESKRKSSEKQKGRKHSAERNRHLSEVMKGENNPFYGKKHTKETCELLSKINIERLLKNDGVNTASNSSKKGEFYSEKNKCHIKYDSTYEVQAYKLLEKRDDVISYGRCKFSIPYILEEKECNYMPDIIITFSNSDKKTIVEIKPKRRLKEQINIAKFKALRTYCILNNFNCKVWTEQKLFKNNIEYRNLLKELMNEKQET